MTWRQQRSRAPAGTWRGGRGAGERPCSTRRSPGACPRSKRGLSPSWSVETRRPTRAPSPFSGCSGHQPGSRIGENGQGLALKLAINISLAVQMLAFSEGLLLAARDGVDQELASEVMTQKRDRLADAEGACLARPRPSPGGMVRRRTDAQG